MYVVVNVRAHTHFDVDEERKSGNFRSPLEILERMASSKSPAFLMPAPDCTSAVAVVML